MKVLVLNGSPKKQSDTFRMTERFLKGLNAAGEHEVTVVNVIEKAIAPCKGCFGCWQKMDGHCVIDDDQNEILDLYKAADVIIWSFPLYVYGMPSHLKAVLDRTIPLVKMKMLEEGEVPGLGGKLRRLEDAMQTVLREPHHGLCPGDAHAERAPGGRGGGPAAGPL